MHDYYAMTIPGIETLAFSEIRAHFPDSELEKFGRGIVLFRSAAHANDLLELRTTEDVFAQLAHIPGLGRGPEALRVLHAATEGANVNKALAAWRQAHHGAVAHTWRVVSQMEGTHAFLRKEAGQAVHDALRQSLPRGMHAVPDDADLECWLWLHGSEAVIGFRLSDASMRHRTWKREHLPASLRPSVAAAMAFLSSPRDDDVVLDPMCGAGTVIIERAHMAPAATLMGGDINNEAVILARRNARSAHVPVEWHTWDAQALPLADASVSALLVNLPFGKQIGDPATNAIVYAKLAQEFRRVTQPSGRLVALTSDDRLWDETLREHGWRVEKKIVIVILGQPATIFLAT
jgi:tRNA (guanine6-N2)-methyltransferase